jgi:hypothetical protein
MIRNSAMGYLPHTQERSGWGRTTEDSPAFREAMTSKVIFLGPAGNRIDRTLPLGMDPHAGRSIGEGGTINRGRHLRAERDVSDA